MCIILLPGKEKLGRWVIYGRETMNYFVSCLYSDLDKYHQILEDLSLQNDDKLWILGDVIDGDEDHPERSLMLLNEIMNNKNVRMVLGDHEYLQNMRYVSYNDQSTYETWKAYISNMDMPGTALTDFFENEMGKGDQAEYFDYLLSLELSEVVKIGDRYFYLVHGSPIPYVEAQVSQWQLEVCTKLPNLTMDYWRVISLDPMIYPFMKEQKPMSEKNTIVISGQYAPEDAANSVKIPLGDSGIFYYNKILCIGRKHIDDPIPVVGIDAAGFFIKGIY